MDVVLEVFDTFLFDRLYATLLPIHSSVSSFDPVSTIAASFKGFASPNATEYTYPIESPLSKSSWQFEPASQLVSFPPSEYAYMSRWDRDNVYRQFITLYLMAWIAGLAIYFICATFSYIFIFDHSTFQHPKYLKNQMALEIQQTLRSVPVMAIFTVPFFVLEVRGYSFMYDSAADPGFDSPMLKLLGSSYNWLQFPLFLMFTDLCIYWIHRGLHHPRVYRYVHKPHHKWIMPTPYASIAFHPLDGFAQSIPYHVFPFIFPLHKFAYIALFVFVQIWTVMIHDGEYIANSPVINGAACHTMHHLYFNYNYGQFTTLWDRLGGSYRKPNDELFQKETKMSKEEWQRQTKEMERMVVEVEGKDERSYGPVDEDSAISKKTQ